MKFGQICYPNTTQNKDIFASFIPSALNRAGFSIKWLPQGTWKILDYKLNNVQDQLTVPNKLELDEMIMMTSFACFLFLCLRKLTIRSKYLIKELIQDTYKINTLSQLGWNWFSILNIIMMIKFSLCI